MPALLGLIFDLDGTLFNSAPDLRKALNRTLQDYGRAPLDLTTVASFTGDGLMPLLSRGFAASGEPLDESQAREVFGKFIDNYNALASDPGQLYPGVVATLDRARQNGLQLGLCTNKQEAETHRLLKDVGIDSYFGFVAGGDTFPWHKPHPGHVEGVMQKLGLQPENCVMVGDSINDIIAAQKAGVKAIAVTHGYGGSDLSADAVVPGFAAIPAALRQLGFEFPE